MKSRRQLRLRKKQAKTCRRRRRHRRRHRRRTRGGAAAVAAGTLKALAGVGVVMALAGGLFAADRVAMRDSGGEFDPQPYSSSSSSESANPGETAAAAAAAGGRRIKLVHDVETRLRLNVDGAQRDYNNDYVFVNFIEKHIAGLGFEKSLVAGELLKHACGGYGRNEYVRSITRVGQGAFGFAVKIDFGCKENSIITCASTILKSTLVKGTTNLAKEFLVGWLLNKYRRIFPCFVETYGWYYHNMDIDTAADADSDQPTTSFYQSKTQKAPVSYISKLPLGGIGGGISVMALRFQDRLNSNCLFAEPGRSSSSSRCMLTIQDPNIDSQQLQHICQHNDRIAFMQEYVDGATLFAVYGYCDIPTFFKQDFFAIMVQVFLPMASLMDKYSHHDLNYQNIILTTHDNTNPIIKIEIYDSTNPSSGTTMEIFTRYVVKIIDNGNAFMDDNAKPSNAADTAAADTAETAAAATGFRSTRQLREDVAKMNLWTRAFPFRTSKWGFSIYDKAPMQNITIMSFFEYWTMSSSDFFKNFQEQNPDLYKHIRGTIKLGVHKVDYNRFKDVREFYNCLKEFDNKSNATKDYIATLRIDESGREAFTYTVY